MPAVVNRETLQSCLEQYFGGIADPRVERTRAHQLLDIIAIALFAVLSGADSWVAIETDGKAKQDWLASFLALPNGIPSHDTFARVFARLDPEAFEASFQQWVNAFISTLEGQLIAIDGKTLKGSYDREEGVKALQLVSAWASEHRLVLGHRDTSETRYFLSSLNTDAQTFAGYIRAHWGVENQLHWCLDVVFTEDASRIRKDHAPRNMSLLRRLALNLLRQESSKGSLAMKRYRAGLDDQFMLQILMAGIPPTNAQSAPDF